MYIYIYDLFVNQKKYDKALARVETRITDLGLSGKIVRMGVMTSINDVIDSEVKKGANCIVAVGNNQIFSQALNAVVRLLSFNKDIIFGFIPIGKDDNEVAGLLGIGSEEVAAEVLAARLVSKLDLGKVNNNYFLTQAEITTIGTKVEIDENYSIEMPGEGSVVVTNLPLPDNDISSSVSDPFDHKLELFINSKKTKKITSLKSGQQNNSYFSFKIVRLLNPKYPLILDKFLQVTTPATITIAEEKINLIVGKGRGF